MPIRPEFGLIIGPNEARNGWQVWWYDEPPVPVKTIDADIRDQPMPNGWFADGSNKPHEVKSRAEALELVCRHLHRWGAEGGIETEDAYYIAIFNPTQPGFHCGFRIDKETGKMWKWNFALTACVRKEFDLAGVRYRD